MGNLWKEIELIDKVKKMKSSGVDLNKNNNPDKKTALHILTEKGNLLGARIMLDEGADMEKKDVNNCTPLALAVIDGNVDMTKIFIDHGADVNSVCNVKYSKEGLLRWNEEDETIFVKAVELAVDNKENVKKRSAYLTIARLLIENGLDTNNFQNKEIAKNYKSIEKYF
ncbi:Ankyrin repeat-containing protein [Lachnospiraceae bacterium C7]|nr:Ankyrin repeat-containing protein [Lachnospiraceae bacterium C7]